MPCSIHPQWVHDESDCPFCVASKVAKDVNSKYCECVVKTRNEGESQRDWFKRWMCMYHWQQTDYYQAKLVEPRTAAGSLD